MTVQTNINISLDWAFWVVIAALIAWVSFLAVNNRSKDKLESARQAIESKLSRSAIA
jgi:hypothetical protein